MGTHDFVIMAQGRTKKLDRLLLVFLIVYLSIFRFAFANAEEFVIRDFIISSSKWPDCSSLQTFGASCARLENASDPEKKAISIWKNIQKITVVGRPPREPAYGNFYIISPIKLLNVYGVHWCDGLSRIMTMTWRALGYRADKLYYFGHTLADCAWRDADGILRWHLFDVSQHWFVYNRSGTHIATAKELSLDHSLLFFPSKTPIPSAPSLVQPSYVHAGHLKLPSHKMGLSLRAGEKITFLWDNIKKPYLDLYKRKNRRQRGPYKITYGNGILEYHVPSRGAYGTFEFSIPYVISDAWIEANITKNNPKTIIEFSISTDGGRHWKNVWTTGDSIGTTKTGKINICTKFDPNKRREIRKITPFGRYNFLFRYKINKFCERADDIINSLKVNIVFQHNIFSLPMLMPGENTINLKGKLQDGYHLNLQYVWYDKKGRRHVEKFIAPRLPFSDQLFISGHRWEDVRCRVLAIWPEKTTSTNSLETGSQKAFHKHGSSIFARTDSIEKFIGTRAPRHLRSPSFYTKELNRLLALEKNIGKKPVELKKLTRTIRDHILALAALREKSAEDILRKVIEEDISHPYLNKVWAAQALYQCVGRRAIPYMMKLLKKDQSIKWYDPSGRYSDDAMWLHTVSIASAILAEIGTFDKKQEAADLIADILFGKRTNIPLNKMWRGKEISWALIKALGKLGSRKHAKVLKRYLPEMSDATALAIKALGKIGDSSILPEIKKILKDYRYAPIGENCIEAIGHLGSKDDARFVYPFLSHWDEDFRAAALLALGRLGDKDSIPLIERMREKESLKWVRMLAQKTVSYLKSL